jgi:hypothetical protein
MHLDEEDGPLVFHHACRLGLEGIVSKRRDSPYSSGQEQEPERAWGEARGRGELDAVAQVAAVAPPPPELDGDQISLTVPIRFKLPE